MHASSDQDIKIKTFLRELSIQILHPALEGILSWGMIKALKKCFPSVQVTVMFARAFLSRGEKSKFNRHIKLIV